MIDLDRVVAEKTEENEALKKENEDLKSQLQALKDQLNGAGESKVAAALHNAQATDAKINN